MTAPLALQPAFPGFCSVTEAVERLATQGGIEERGAIYTKREVVDFILNLAGYKSDATLLTFRLLEPSFGDGDFLLPAIDRLLDVAVRENSLTVNQLAPAIRAVELHRPTFEMTKKLVIAKLREFGMSLKDSIAITETWLLQGDFLLSEFQNDFTHIVGNPPYVRQEAIPDVLMAEYRSRYNTIYDRADIYVPFIERSLNLLSENGKLAFICADRWMKNKYGKKLRELVSRDYALTTYVDMNDVDAFHAEVSAYPAITVIEKAAQKKTRVFSNPQVTDEFFDILADEMTTTKLPSKSAVKEIENIATGGEPWILGSFDELSLVRRLEAKLPALENAGCKVGIGVATGADKAFISDYDALDVEVCRKLPIVMTRDISQGDIAWQGKGIINPFGDDGKLVKLEGYPKLAAYLEERKDLIAGRHVAKKSPHNWYRTIDRIYPELALQEKLLIPDIKRDASIIYESGKYYPHHNLYYITSKDWDIRALQAVMRSGIARLFVALYSTRMRGGYLRFQAQYLRKIRIPSWDRVSDDLRGNLIKNAKVNDLSVLNELVSQLYGLSSRELKLIQRNE